MFTFDFKNIKPKISDNYQYSILGTPLVPGDTYPAITVQTDYLKYSLRYLLSSSTNKGEHATLGSSDVDLGIVFDPSNSGNFPIFSETSYRKKYLNDFLSPGAPYEAWGFYVKNSTKNTKYLISDSNTYVVLYDLQSNYVNNNTNIVNAWKISDYHYIFSIKRVDSLTYPGIITIEYLTVPGIPVIGISMKFTNTSTDNLDVIAFREIDPDQDVYNDFNIYETDNEILSSNLVNAHGINTNLDIAVWNPAPSRCWNREVVRVNANMNQTWGFVYENAFFQSLPSKSFRDDALSAQWDLGTIKPRATKGCHMFYIFTENKNKLYEWIDQIDCLDKFIMSMGYPRKL